MNKQLLNAKKFFVTLALSISCCCGLYAQLSGNKTIGGTSPDYPTLQAAISDINTQGVAPGSGGIRFLVAAGHTETVSNLVITATGTSTDSIIFEKNGPGANPLITASAGSGMMDGIIKLKGSDYMAFDGIDLLDPSTNLTESTQMEWGYAILRSSETDGSQHIVIRNCTISLQKANINTVGIYAANHNDSSMTEFTPADATGRNAYFKIYNNSISNVYSGIIIKGPANQAYYDEGHEIGIEGANTISDFGGGSATASGISVSGQDSVRIANNNISGGLGTTGPAYGIYTATGLSSFISIHHNTVSLNTSGNAAGISNGIGSSLGIVHIYNNVIKNSSVTGSFSGISSQANTPFIHIYNDSVYNITFGTVGFYGISVSTTNGKRSNSRVWKNVIFDVQSLPTTYYADMAGIMSTAPGISIDSNTIYNLTLPVNVWVYAYGIYQNASSYTDTVDCFGNNIYEMHGDRTPLKGIHVASQTANIYSNTIHHLSCTYTLLGIYNANSYGGVNIYRNKIYDLENPSIEGDFGDGLTAAVIGIYAGLGTPMNIHHNLISNLRAPYSQNGLDVIGMAIDGNTTANIYYNTVYLHGATYSSYSGSTVLYTWRTTMTLRNNIFVNTIETKGGARATIHRGYDQLSYNTYQTASNNNLFYAGIPASDRLIYLDYTRPIKTIQQFKTWFGPRRDSLSFSEMPHFLDTNGASSDFLRIDPSQATQIESGGFPIAGYANDFTQDGVRQSSLYPLSGQLNGGGTSPDLGAYEGDYTPVPDMAYESGITFQLTGDAFKNVPRQGILGIQVITTGLKNPLRAFSFTLNADNTTNISDLLNARLYYGASGNVFDTSRLFGTVVPAIDSFIITGDQQLLSADTNYFWLTYDIAATALSGNIIDAGCLGIVLSSGRYTPDTINPAGSKIVPAPLLGDYMVGGTAPNFGTLTAAITELNLKGISGPVSFLLADSIYETAETFPLIINRIIGTTATDTFVIKPDTGVSAIILGAGSALFILNGADYTTIEGSNNGTNSKNISLVNYGGGAGIWARNNPLGGDSCVNNTFRNLIIDAPYSIGIGFGGNNINTSSQGTGHHFNKVEACEISNASTGICFIGSARKSRGNSITGNKLSTGGILVTLQDSIRITGNTITNIESFYGISLGIPSFISYTPPSSEVTNAVVTENKIGPLNVENSAAVGIAYGSVNSGTSIVANNMIYDIAGNGTSGGRITAGMYIGTGGTSHTKVYYNTVLLKGSTIRTTPSCYGIAIGNANPSVDIQNNIFDNMQTSASVNSNTYAIGFEASTFTGVTSNYNSFYTSGSNARFAVTGGLGGSIVGTIRNTLVDLQIATGKDANSVSVDPGLDSASGYRPQVLPVVLGGTHLPDFLTDIDGVLRNGSTPTMGAYEVIPVLNDIGVLRIYNESNSLRVLIRNYGSNPVSTFNVDYQLNSDLPVSQSPAISINPYDTASVTFSPFTLPDGINDLKVYTSLPNSSTDANAANDTLITELSFPMSGVYTIGGTTPNFATFTDAVSEMLQRGINGDVTFSVRTGTYNDQISLPLVPMDSANRIITFTSEAAHRDSVILTYASNSWDSGYTVFLNHSENIRITHLTISATGTTYANAIRIYGNTSNTVIDNCRILSPGPANTSYYQTVIAGDDLTGNNNQITNNTIENGFYSMSLNGTEDPGLGLRQINNTVIENNVFTNSEYGAIGLYFNINTKIRNNTFSTFPAATPGYSAVACASCDSLLEVIGNRIDLPFGYGLMLYNCKGDLSGIGGIISNNVINIGDGYGIYLSNNGGWQDGCYNQRFYHNTVTTSSANGNAGYFGVDDDTWYYHNHTHVEVKNNIFFNTIGIPIRVPLITKFTHFMDFDYNSLYTTGPTLVRRAISTNYVHDSSYSNLIDWQNASNGDFNSISYRPGLTGLVPDPSDSASWSLNGRAVFLDSIYYTHKDINGNPRPVTREQGVPDIGAHEFTPTSTPPLTQATGWMMPDSTQYFFSPFSTSDTVARIKWGPSSSIPSTLAVRQYVGIPPPGISDPENFMYFFVDMKDSGSAPYQYELDLYYKDAWLGTNPAEADVRLIRNNSSGWELVSNLSPTSTDPTRNMFNALTLSEFNLFTGTDMNLPLPVTLLKLTADRTGDQVQVNWQTANEINAARFEVEFSSAHNVEQWTKIGTVNAKGNTNTTTSYRFTDMNASLDKFRNTLYYRLKIVDADGRYVYSNVVAVKPKATVGSEGISIYPNPFVDALFLSTDFTGDQKVKVSFADMTGKTLMEKEYFVEKGQNTLVLKSENLQPGMYFITTEINGSRQTQKLIRNK
jgi:hypothetical protein